MRRMLLVLVLVASACTSSRQTTADLSQAAKYDQAAATMASAVAQYRQVAISATTPADCAAALQQYVASIQPADTPGIRAGMETLTRILSGNLAAHGRITIGKDSGLFEARGPRAPC